MHWPLLFSLFFSRGVNLFVFEGYLCWRTLCLFCFIVPIFLADSMCVSKFMSFHGVWWFETKTKKKIGRRQPLNLHDGLALVGRTVSDTRWREVKSKTFTDGKR